MGFAFLFQLLLLSAFSIGVSKGQLSVGFYANTCPNAESIVSSVVRNAAQSSSNIPPVLLRLHFHDCFVEGCDGSILIENGPNAERHAFGHQGVGGFEVIEQAKAQLETTCPGVVSCADIVALAARDAIVLANGPSYDVPTGRRDGRVSDVSLAANMPDDGDVNVRLPMDRGSEQSFDKQILDNVRNGFAVLESDARLYDDDSTRTVADSYFGFLSPIFGPSFEADFVDSIVKMGRIGVKTGSKGEIRRVCTAFN
ncbi:Peroxidase N1 [Hibiscus syriacus]|uniref:peroxidase n=1 Tax=Hibiscus syriacus TaxID=106335 RepID=A0A6A2ZFA2_HIBSY|nr:Peroxidase N1 [Hibiscus syriacus]